MRFACFAATCRYVWLTCAFDEERNSHVSVMLHCGDQSSVWDMVVWAGFKDGFGGQLCSKPRQKQKEIQAQLAYCSRPIIAMFGRTRTDSVDGGGGEDEVHRCWTVAASERVSLGWLDLHRVWAWIGLLGSRLRIWRRFFFLISAFAQSQLLYASLHGVEDNRKSYWLTLQCSQHRSSKYSLRLYSVFCDTTGSCWICDSTQCNLFSAV